ncbi:hypothetical protein [Opitutus terrae]|uniref:PEP-CTERM protein-sorting domain-containing protein n=1 Tax=Opitutus terrae (strain DSM 11246 / JCM 15787 / PB90-1) TaxID=452637 RepID=B1ZNW6_OPITP|nr:hypothetical protein [Opitutus terrae]ACB75490.1 hypothetical protein Oter_2207 [Opitutus terrae PB90-1]
MKRFAPLLAFTLLATTASAQLYQIEFLLELEKTAVFGDPAWTMNRIYLNIYYETGMVAAPEPAGSLQQAYLPVHPTLNYWALDGGPSVLIDRLVITDTALLLNAFDPATNTRLDAELVFLHTPPPGRTLPLFSPDHNAAPNPPDFTTIFNLNGRAVSTVSFSTDGGFGFPPGGFRAELNDTRFSIEPARPLPPPISPVPEPSTYAWGALSLLGGLMWARGRTRRRDKVAHAAQG